MILNDNEILRRLEETSNKLLQPPDSKNELLKLLEETESVLKNVEQGPSQALKDALIPTLKGLIAESLIKNPAPDVRIVVAVCFNEITRITAPDAPYDDDRMKKVFELIVEAFDNVSALSGRSYDKAVSIIVNVANVRSCVLMLDLGCEDLIIKMFELFLKNIRSDHPKAVFSAMETIMTLIIEESEAISLELLRVLLNSVRQEHEKSSSMSWKLARKVIDLSAKMLGPHLRKAISSGLINEVDYAPMVKLIYQGGSVGLKHKHVGQAADQAVILKTPYGRKKYKEDIIGCRVKIYWPLDKEYYSGRIASYDPLTKLHRVEYDDGDAECLYLHRETFEFTASACEDDDQLQLIKRLNKELSMSSEIIGHLQQIIC